MFKGATAVESTPSSPFTGVTADAPEAAKPEIGLVQGGVGGLEHGLHRASRGLLKTAEFMAGQPISNQVKKLHQWAVSKGMPSMAPTDEMMAKEEQFVKDAPWTANVGQVVGETIPEAATAFLGAPAAEKVASTVLPQFAQKLAPAIADVGLNAATSATFAPENKGEAAAWAAGGTAAGRALPGAVDLVKKGVSKASDYVVPGRSVTRQLTKHLGADEFADVAGAVKKGVASGDSMLPQTTAAMSDNVKMAGLESGARGRGLIDFSKHDEAVKAAAKSKLTSITSAADDVGKLTSEVGSVTAETERRLGNMPLGKGRKAAVVEALEGLKSNQKILGDDDAMSAVEKAIAKINDPNSNTLMLKVLSDKMGDEAKYAPIKNVLMEAAAERSKNISAASGELTKDIQGKLTAAQASRSLRGEYADQGRRLKDINELNLNRSLTRPGLDSDVVEEGAKLSDELRRSKLYDSSTAQKSVRGGPEVGDLAKLYFGFKTGGITLAADWAGKHLDKLTRVKMDAVARDPEEFLKLVTAKEARGAALEAWEKKVVSAIKAGGFIGGRVGSAIGKE